MQISPSEEYLTSSSSSSSSSMSPSSSLPSTWADLPSDILLSIRDKLELHDRSDLLSFRSVCSHWHSMVPIPDHFRGYEISFNRKNNVMYFTKINNNIDKDNNDINNTRPISLPFFTSSRIYFVCSSNGWLVFKTRNNKNIYLFNPVSNHKIIFPRLSYIILRPTFRCISHLLLLKVVVSSSLIGGIVVVCIVGIFHRDKNIMEKRAVVCRYGVDKQWRLLKDESKDIIDIILIGSDNVYVLDKYLNLYLLDKSCSPTRLVRFRLWVLKQTLQADGLNDPIDRELSSCGSYMEASGKADLKIYASCWRSFLGPNWISLKIDAAELCNYNADDDVVDVACEIEWADFYFYLDLCRKYFTPLLRPTIIKCLGAK